MKKSTKVNQKSWLVVLLLALCLAFTACSTAPTEVVTSSSTETTTLIEIATETTEELTETSIDVTELDTKSTITLEAQNYDINTIKDLYDELQSEYENHKISFDKAAWAQYMSDLNDTTDNIKNSSKDVSVRLAVADLRQLASEYGKELQGRGDYDTINTFETYMEQHLQ